MISTRYTISLLARKECESGAYIYNEAQVPEEILIMYDLIKTPT